jgi:hypothetical protein
LPPSSHQWGQSSHCNILSPREGVVFFQEAWLTPCSKRG